MLSLLKKTNDNSQIERTARLWMILAVISSIMLAVSIWRLISLYTVSANLNCVQCEASIITTFIMFMYWFEIGLSIIFVLSGLLGRQLAIKTRLRLYTQPFTPIILICGVSIYTLYSLVPLLLILVSSFGS